MSKDKTNGTRQVCGRLVDNVIDPILFAISRAQDLTDEEKRKFSKLVVTSGHEAIKNYIYGIEDEPVGVAISYEGNVLNDQSYEMPDIARELDFSEFSRYDDEGIEKPL